MQQTAVYPGESGTSSKCLGRGFGSRGAAGGHKVKLGGARQSKAKQGEVRLGKARRDEARQGKIRLSKMMQGRARTGQDKAE